MEIFHSSIQDFHRQVEVCEIEIAPVATTLAGVGRFYEFHTGCGPKKFSGNLGDPLANPQMAGIVVRNPIHIFAMEPAGGALFLKICVKTKIFHQISHGILVL